MKARLLHWPSVRISLDHLWPLVVLFGVFFFLSTHPIRPHDFWWHLRAGQEIVMTGRIPVADQFSFTMPGQPYDNYAAYWLAEGVYFLLYEAGGMALIIFAHTLVVTAAYTLLLWLCWQVSGSWRVAALSVLLAAVLGFNDWNVRPQAVAFPLFVLFLWIIYTYRRRPRPWLLIVFPVGMLVWVNSHGSFVLGFLLLCIWLADALWQGAKGLRAGNRGGAFGQALASGVALAASMLVCLANPRGLGILTYLRSLSANPAVRNLAAEWAPPTFHTLGGALFLVGLLLAFVILILSPRYPTFFEMILVLVFGLLGLQAVRNSVWFGMAVAPVMAGHLSAISQQHVPGGKARGAGRPGLNLAIAAALFVVGVLSLPWFKHLLPLPDRLAGLVSQETPVAGTEFLLHKLPPAPLFHEMGYGSYLIWAVFPKYLVFVDPRIELYPVRLWQEYIGISAAQEGWEDRLAERGINTLQLDRLEQPALVEAASLSEQWRKAYEDQRTVVFVRRDHPWWKSRGDLPVPAESGG